VPVPEDSFSHNPFKLHVTFSHNPLLGILETQVSFFSLLSKNTNLHVTPSD
jgi:hypothetical protein